MKKLRYSLEVYITDQGEIVTTNLKVTDFTHKIKTEALGGFTGKFEKDTFPEFLRRIQWHIDQQTAAV